MIDSHCHILPEIGEGPEKLEEAVGMAVTALEQDIHTIVATPSYCCGKSQYTYEDITGAVKLFHDQIQQLDIPVRIVPGQSITIYPDMIHDLEQGVLLTLNDTKYVLVKWPYENIPAYTRRLFYNMQEAGFIPIIAHPERHKCIMKNLNVLYDIVSNGTLVQIDAKSILGKYGKGVRRLTRKLIQANLVHLIASNASDRRSIHLKEAHKTLDPVLADMLKSNTERLLFNEPLEKFTPVQVKTTGIRRFLP